MRQNCYYTQLIDKYIEINNIYQVMRVINDRNEHRSLSVIKELIGLNHIDFFGRPPSTDLFHPNKRLINI